MAESFPQFGPQLQDIIPFDALLLENRIPSTPTVIGNIPREALLKAPFRVTAPALQISVVLRDGVAKRASTEREDHPLVQMTDALIGLCEQDGGDWSIGGSIWSDGRIHRDNRAFHFDVERRTLTPGSRFVVSAATDESTDGTLFTVDRTLRGVQVRRSATGWVTAGPTPRPAAVTTVQQGQIAQFSPTHCLHASPPLSDGGYRNVMGCSAYRMLKTSKVIALS